MQLCATCAAAAAAAAATAAACHTMAAGTIAIISAHTLPGSYEEWLASNMQLLESAQVSLARRAGAARP